MKMQVKFSETAGKTVEAARGCYIKDCDGLTVTFTDGSFAVVIALQGGWDTGVVLHEPTLSVYECRSSLTMQELRVVSPEEVNQARTKIEGRVERETRQREINTLRQLRDKYPEEK